MTRMFNPPHPGAVLKEELESLGITAESFAGHIGVETGFIERILCEEVSVSADIAVRIAKAIDGPDATMWLRMQASHDLFMVERNLDVSFIKPIASPNR